MNTRNKSIPPATAPAVVDKTKLSELPSEGGTTTTGDEATTAATITPDPITPAAGTTDPITDPVVTEEPAEDKEYVAVFGGPMHDPESKVCFTGVPALAPMTKWLDIQIKAGKIKEQATEAPAK